VNATHAKSTTGAFGLRRIATAGLLAALSGLLAPEPASAAGPVQVFADFASAAGESGVQGARLWIDGEEVTGGAAVSPIRISYALPGDFPTGTHQARVVVVDSLGRSHEKSWSFEVSEQRPEVVAFFTDRLTLELDALPRRTNLPRLSISGTSLPEVEVELRRDGLLVARTETSHSGRFSLPLDLDAGENDLSLTALRPLTGEEGRPVHLRLQRRLLTDLLQETGPREARALPRRGERETPDAPAGPADRSLPGGDPETVEARRSELPPAGAQRGRRDAPDAPEDRELPHDEVDALIVITKPGAGESVRNGRVTVLGLAPAGWQVVVSVNGRARGSDVANPAGHFTIAQVRLDEGPNRLVAEAKASGSGELVSSEPVEIQSGSAGTLLSLDNPPRGNLTVRSPAWRLEGRARPGAELEVEVNGLLVMTGLAGPDGGFALQVPLEAGLNRVVVEAFDAEGFGSERSRPLGIRRAGNPRRGQVQVVGSPPLVRPQLPGHTRPARLRPLN
jgi:hypothetical protein